MAALRYPTEKAMRDALCDELRGRGYTVEVGTERVAAIINGITVRVDIDRASGLRGGAWYATDDYQRKYVVIDALRSTGEFGGLRKAHVGLGKRGIAATAVACADTMERAAVVQKMWDDECTLRSLERAAASEAAVARDRALAPFRKRLAGTGWFLDPRPEGAGFRLECHTDRWEELKDLTDFLDGEAL